MSRTTWKDYFTFSKKERVAIIILLALLLLFVVLPFFYPYKQQKVVIDNTLQQQFAQSDKTYNDSNNENDQGVYEPSQQAEKVKAELFAFDPNTLNREDWKRLGIRDRTIQTIINYRNKGGSFKQPADIRKIYGLSKQDADRLIPYVHIKQQENLQSSNQKDYASPSYQAEPLAKKYNIIDINTATAEEWKALPGIGDVLSNRIVKFRASLGGFTSIDQLKKTYGLPDSTFLLILPYLKISGAAQE